jgi:hypothetical protein
MLEWFIDLFTSVITWVLALFGIDYAKLSEKKVDFAPTVEIVPTVEVPVALEENLP